MRRHALHAFTLLCIALANGCGSRSGLPSDERTTPEGCRRLFAFERRVGGAPGFGTTQLLGAALTPDGDLLLLGRLDGTLDLAGETLVSSDQAFADLFVARTSPRGALRWVRQFTGGEQSAFLSGGIGALADGRALIAFDSQDVLDLGLGATTPIGFRDLVIARLSAAGTTESARRFGGAQAHVDVHGTTFDPAGRLMVVGSISGFIDIPIAVDLGGGVLPAAAKGEIDGFYAGYTADLDHVFSARMSLPGVDTMDAAAFDEHGGSVSGWGAGPSGIPELALEAGASSGYLLRIDELGKPRFASVAPSEQSILQTRFAYVEAIPNGVIVGGSWGATADWTGTELAGEQHSRGVVSAFDADGSLRFSHFSALDGESASLSLGSDRHGRGVLFASRATISAIVGEQGADPVLVLLDHDGEPLCELPMDSRYDTDDATLIADPASDAVFVAGNVQAGQANPIGFFVEAFALPPNAH